MDKNNLLFIIFMTSICLVISMGFVSANDNITSNDNLTSIGQDILNNADAEMQSGNPDDLNNNISTNKSSSSTSEDIATINYLIKNKEKYDNIVKKSTKKDRTFKLGKYKLTISKADYKKFLYVEFIDKYIKSGKNITLLEKVFKIKSNDFMRIYGTCVTFMVFPSHCVIKNTNKIITQKIGTIKDYKTKKIFFKEYKKAKKFNKQLNYPRKIKYDKKLKKYYLKVNVAKYKKIISKKARVYIKLIYLNNRFELTTYTKYDHKHNPMPTDIVRDYTIYKSSKSIKKLNKSKTKKQYTY